MVGDRMGQMRGAFLLIAASLQARASRFDKNDLP